MLNVNEREEVDILLALKMNKKTVNDKMTSVTGNQILLTFTQSE